MTDPKALLSKLQSDAGGFRVGAWAAAVSVITLGAAGTVSCCSTAVAVPSLGPTVMVLAETLGSPRRVRATCWPVSSHCRGLPRPARDRPGHGPAGHPTGITRSRIVAACLSLALTALVLQALHAPHPPAGATTLIISLGLLTTPTELLTIALSVLLVAAVAIALNLLAGVRQIGTHRPHASSERPSGASGGRRRA